MDTPKSVKNRVKGEKEGKDSNYFPMPDDSLSLKDKSSKGIFEEENGHEKEKFLNSLLRHDLKSKAIVIEGYLNLLEEANLSEEERKYLDNATRAAKEEVELIEKVKDLMERDEGETKKSEINSILKEIVDEKKTQASENNMKMEYKGSNCRIKGGLLLKELFQNLIENSIKHSGGEKVRINVQEDGSETIVIVEDDGRGIPNEQRGKIFQKGFKKGENGGSGLGMFLVDKIAKSYDGEIKVGDSELGGARFEVHFKKD